MTDIETLHADLQRATEEIAGPVPTIAAAPDCGVDLLRGLAHNGRMQTQALVRELNGRDEETLARYKKVEDLYDAVIAVGTERVGDLDLSQMALGERQTYLRQLLVGERDLLFLAVARVTYGDDRTYPVKCLVCGREQDLTLKLSEDFKAKVANTETTGTFHYITSKGDDLEVRLTTGADQMEILKKDNPTGAEMNTTMLSSCIVSVNGGVVVDPLNFTRGMSMRDRSGLLSDMLDRQPNVDLTVKFPCFGCQEEQQATFGWLDFFRL